MDHISSRQSLQASTDRLLAAADSIDDAGLAALGSELAAVSQLLTREPGLRRTLSEATTSVGTRASIVDRLLAGKVGQPTLDLIDVVVHQDWASGRDLRDALTRLSRTALFLRAERGGELDDVEDQLFRFGRIVDGAPDLSVLLDDPTTAGDARAALVSRLLAGRAHPLTIELLTALATDTGGRSFSHGVRELVDQAAERQDKVVAVVETALPLSEAETERLVAGLSRVYGRNVTVHLVVEPSLTGGLRVRVGDEVIDGSVAGRLDALRRRMSS